jgi:hypothetical protein
MGMQFYGEGAEFEFLPDPDVSDAIKDAILNYAAEQEVYANQEALERVAEDLADRAASKLEERGLV